MMNRLYMSVLKAAMQSVTHCYTGFCLICCSIHECVQACRTECDGLLQAHLCCPSGMVFTIIFQSSVHTQDGGETCQNTDSSARHSG